MSEFSSSRYTFMSEFLRCGHTFMSEFSGYGHTFMRDSSTIKRHAAHRLRSILPSATVKPTADMPSIAANPSHVPLMHFTRRAKEGNKRMAQYEFPKVPRLLSQAS